MNTRRLHRGPRRAVAGQEEAHKKADDVKSRRIPLAKAFGFKDIAGEADEILVTRWLAKLEAETGLKGDLALVAFLARAGSKSWVTSPSGSSA
jgi:hypothetical protein